MSFRIHSAGSGSGPVRQPLHEANDNARRVEQHAVPNFGLSHNSATVGRAYEMVVQCVRHCIDSEPRYSLQALNELHQAANRYANAFEAASHNEQNPGAVRGNLAAALEDARGRLQVRPSHHASSLRALLNHLLERLEQYSNPDAFTLNEFPALYAGLDAYLKSLGAQPLHGSNGLARISPGVRPRIRTPEDIHRHAIEIVRPHTVRETQAPAVRDHVPGAGEVIVPATLDQILNEEPPQFPPPGYVLNAIPGRCELPADLALRVSRYLRKLNKEPGLTSFRDPSRSALLTELKALLGLENLIPEHRGEILMRLAEGIPQRPARMGIPEAEQLARLFLRFLAPGQLPAEFTQSPAAILAGVNTPEFNPETLVPDASKPLIVEAMIQKLGHLAHAGATACLVLQTVLRDMEEGTVLHASLLSRAAGAIETIQHSRRDAVRFHTWIETIVDAITVLDAKVHTNATQINCEALLPSFDSLQSIAYELRGLAVRGAPVNWTGHLQALPAYQRLLTNLRYAGRLPAGDPPPEVFLPDPPNYSQISITSSRR